MNINTAFPSNYLKAADLNGKAVPVTIHQVKIEKVGRDQQEKPVVYFMGKEKGMVLNVTNAKKIAQIAGSAETEDWGGTVIAIYPTEVEFGGETVEAIRVKVAKGAVAKPVPEMVHPDLSDDDISF